MYMQHKGLPGRSKKQTMHATTLELPQLKEVQDDPIEANQQDEYSRSAVPAKTQQLDISPLPLHQIVKQETDPEGVDQDDEQFQDLMEEQRKTQDSKRSSGRRSSALMLQTESPKAASRAVSKRLILAESSDEEDE